MRKIVAATALALFCFGAVASDSNDTKNKQERSTFLKPAVLSSGDNSFKLRKVADATGSCHFQCKITICCEVLTESQCNAKLKGEWNEGSACP